MYSVYIFDLSQGLYKTRIIILCNTEDFLLQDRDKLR